MAIDTAAKRKSAVGVALQFLRMGVVPDGTNLDAPQRLHTQGLYSGIVASVQQTWTVQTPASSSWGNQSPTGSVWTVQTPNSGSWA